MTQRMLHAAQILWPAFLIAGVLEMAVFSWVDPALMQWRDWQPDPKTVYSLTFFVFWGAIAASAMISHWMMKTGESSRDTRRARRQARRHQQAGHHHA